MVKSVEIDPVNIAETTKHLIEFANIFLLLIENGIANECLPVFLEKDLRLVVKFPTSGTGSETCQWSVTGDIIKIPDAETARTVTGNTYKVKTGNSL